MQQAGNPYGHREPIRAPADFYGRSREVGSALNLLRHLQSISLVGSRRVGKTSLLHYLSHPSVLTEYNFNLAQYIFPFIDGTKLVDLSQGDIFQHLLTETREGIVKAGLELDLADFPSRGPLTHTELWDALATISNAGLKVVFLLDEFEGLSQNQTLDLGFYSGLRGFTGNLEVAYVTASRHSLFDLTYTEEVLGSPFFNIFSTIQLGLFNEEEARSLIEEPSHSAGMTFSEQTIAFILSLAGNHPLNLQIVCSYAFERQSRKGKLEEVDYRWLRQRLEPELF
jgi:hypothetical protein